MTKAMPMLRRLGCFWLMIHCILSFNCNPHPRPWGINPNTNCGGSSTITIRTNILSNGLQNSHQHSVSSISLQQFRTEISQKQTAIPLKGESLRQSKRNSLNKFRSRIKSLVSTIPPPFLGLSLGCTGIVRCWKLMLDMVGIQDPKINLLLQIYTGFAFSILGVFATKLLVQKDEIQNVDNHAILCTGAMSLASISSLFQPVLPLICKCTWYGSVVLHLSLTLKQYSLRLKSLTTGGNPMQSFWKDLYPPVLLPTVGLAQAAITSPGFGPLASAIGSGMFWLALFQWTLFHPMIFYRMFFVGHFDLPKLPSFFIFNSPCAILLAASCAVGLQTPLLFFPLMTAQVFSMASFCVFYYKNMRNISYSPAWSAATFPSAITASAFTLFARQMGEPRILVILAQILLGISTVSVLTITRKHLQWLWKASSREMNTS